MIGPSQFAAAVVIRTTRISGVVVAWASVTLKIHCGVLVSKRCIPCSHTPIAHFSYGETRVCRSGCIGICRGRTGFTRIAPCITLAILNMPSLRIKPFKVDSNTAMVVVKILDETKIRTCVWGYGAISLNENPASGKTSNIAIDDLYFPGTESEMRRGSTFPR